MCYVGVKARSGRWRSFARILYKVIAAHTHTQLRPRALHHLNLGSADNVRRKRFVKVLGLEVVRSLVEENVAVKALSGLVLELLGAEG